MAGIFNFFRRRGQFFVANQTLVTCHRTFSYGIEEIKNANLCLSQLYEVVSNLIRTNQLKLQATEEIIEKLYNEMSSLGSVALKLKQQIEIDERHIEERKKIVSDIQREILQFRQRLNTLKEEHGFNEWIQKTKEDRFFLKQYQAERIVVEKEIYTTLERINQLSDAHDETDDEIDKLQNLRDNYMEVHEEDMKDYTAQLDTVLQKRKLFAVQPIEKAREVVFLFQSKATDLESKKEELSRIKAMKALREYQIQLQKEEEDNLSERNAELMFRVISDKGEVLKIKGEEDKILPLEYNLPSGDKIKRWVFSK